MAGLLDLFSGDAGLLTGLALMDAGSAKPVRTSLGGGLLGAITNTQQMLQAQEDRKLKQRMTALQEQQLMMALDEAKRQQQRSRAIEDLPGQFMTPGVKPDTMDNRDVGQPGEPRVPSQGFDLAGYANALMRYDPKTGLGLQQLLKKDTTPIKLGKDERLLSHDASRVLVDALPDPGKQSPLAQLMAERDNFPPGHPARAVYDQAIAKASTHQPGVSVSYGAPVAGQDASGNPVFFLPPKDASTPPRVLPGVSPPKKTPPVEFTKSLAGLNELEAGLKSYEAALAEAGGPNAIATGQKKAKLEGAFTALQMGLKNAFELGALAGPDLNILNGMLTSPTSARVLLLGESGAGEQIRQAREYLKNRRGAVYKAHGEQMPAEDVPAPANDVAAQARAELERRRNGGR